MTRTQHINLFNTILKKQEERSIASVYMALRKQYIRVINNVKRGGVNYAASQLNLELFNREMGNAVRKIFIQVGVFMANKTLSNLNKNKTLAKAGGFSPQSYAAQLSQNAGTVSGRGRYPEPSARQSKCSTNIQKNKPKGAENKGADTQRSPLSKEFLDHTHRERGIPSAPFLKYATFGFNQEWINEILNYFNRYLLEKATVAVSATTREKILAILNKAVQEGWSNDQTVRELSNLVEIRNRARMIVRTETVRAANFGVLQGADKYEYETEKEWMAVLDNRVRHSHASVDGQKRENDQPFSNGLLFPGDPNGAPENTINCRCSMAMVAKRDARGRLIPKRNLIAA